MTLPHFDDKRSLLADAALEFVASGVDLCRRVIAGNRLTKWSTKESDGMFMFPASDQPVQQYPRL